MWGEGGDACDDEWGRAKSAWRRSGDTEKKPEKDSRDVLVKAQIIEQGRGRAGKGEKKGK